MKQVIIKQGRPVIEEVPAPCSQKGYVLVKVEYSCISPGTELSSLQKGADPLWKKALKKSTKSAKSH